jgi:acetyltransferase-like isoleucine patch superfamily enzyme
MIFRQLHKALRYMAMRHGKARGMYLRICKPTGVEYADYLRKYGGLHHLGKDSAINRGANITDPAYVSIGSNVLLSDCTILGHDGVIRVLNKAYGKKLDAVGKVVILDNCFIGHGAIVLPNVIIGPNAVVAAGSVVTKDVPAGVVVGGIPAKILRTTESLVEKIEAQTQKYPWHALINSREGNWDPMMEPKLVQMRVAHFYSDDTHKNAQ